MYVCESDWFTQYGPVKHWVRCKSIAHPPTKLVCVRYWFSHVVSVFKMWKSCDFECVQDRYKCCVIFACFFKLCSWCFKQPNVDSGTRATRFSPRAWVWLRFIWENASMLAWYICATTYERSHFTKLLIRVILFMPYHCLYIFVPCLAFRVHVARDLNKKYRS